MNKEYIKFYSRHLNRDMEILVYGHSGKPCLVFPAQNGRYFDWLGGRLIIPVIDQFNNVVAFVGR